MAALVLVLSRERAYAAQQSLLPSHGKKERRKNIKNQGQRDCSRTIDNEDDVEMGSLYYD